MKFMFTLAVIVCGMSGVAFANPEADQAIKACKTKVQPTRAEGGKGNNYTANYDYTECLKEKIKLATKELLAGSAQTTFLTEVDKVADQITQVYGLLEDPLDKLGRAKALDQITDASVIPFYEGVTQAAFEAAKAAKEAPKKS